MAERREAIDPMVEHAPDDGATTLAPVPMTPAPRAQSTGPSSADVISGVSA